MSLPVNTAQLVSIR